MAIIMILKLVTVQWTREAEEISNKYLCVTNERNMHGIMQWGAVQLVVFQIVQDRSVLSEDHEMISAM